MPRKLTLIDLFAGAGGMTCGFSRAGFRPLYAVEIDAAAARTYKRNFGAHVLDTDIALETDFPKADVIVGGPPCQGFSPLGRDRDPHSRLQLNMLWKHYLRAVEGVQPLAFVVENVPQFLRSEQYIAFERRLRRLRPRYTHVSGVLNAADFGVPQLRRRGLIVAVRSDVGVPHLPEPIHTPETYRDVRSAIGDLPIPVGTEIRDVPPPLDLHFGRSPRPDSRARYEAIPEGGNRFDLARNRPDLLPPCWANKPTGTTDVLGRLSWDKPALTIRTEFFKPEKGRYLHPEQHRVITHREAARLQTFPDDFVFEGTKIEIARQIGNAVPPLLAAAVARAVRGILASAST